MPSRTGTAHVVTTTRAYKGKIYRTHLLRRSYREGGSVKNETLGNLSHLPDSLIEIIRRSLQGETFVALGEAFEVIGSRAHGHVRAVTLAMQRLGLAALLGSKASRERELVLAMLAARIVAPSPKLATTRWWHTSTLASDFGVTDANEDDLYAAMDWLIAHQDAIQKKLAARHLHEGGLVLYDLSSSYFEGTTCPLAKLGHNRDGRKGLLQVNYGLLTDARGCPVAVSVHEGNVERAFRSLKTVDLKVRPIHHRTADRVRAHILLCMLAYYVEWHMREAWRELMFADTDQAAKATRDPVAPAQRSELALDKVSHRKLDDGTPAHSFATLMAELGTIVRNTCRTPGASAGADGPTFDIVTTPNATQLHALDLIKQIRP
jgi:hypothetical protein